MENVHTKKPQKAKKTHFLENHSGKAIVKDMNTHDADSNFKYAQVDIQGSIVLGIKDKQKISKNSTHHYCYMLGQRPNFNSQYLGNVCI